MMQRALDVALKAVENNYGENVLLRPSETNVFEIESIHTGCPALDEALGIGGIPRGRITEIYGHESTGKTTLCLMVAANAQKCGTVVYIDTDRAFTTDRAKALGVDTDALLVARPKTGEDALNICVTMIQSGVVSAVIVDSVAALLPRTELLGGVGDYHVGAQSRLMAQALRRLTGVVCDTDCSLIFTNQMRERTVVYGNPYITPGGHALKHYASVRLEMKRAEMIQTNGVKVGRKLNVNVVKSRVGPPHRETQMEIMF